MRSSIWLTGSEGRLGTALLNVLKKNTDYKIVDTDMDVDITDFDAVEHAIDSYRPVIVINCASVSSKDFCEENRVEAFRVNALGARNIAVATRSKNAKLIHFSTDDVFSGVSYRAKNEFDQPTPNTVYGQSKLAGENFVRELNPKHLIVRSSWVYGLAKNVDENRSDFYYEVLEHGKKGEAFNVPINVIGTPTSATELARFFSRILHSNEYGLYHAACEGACTRREFARAVLELNGFDPNLAVGVCVGDERSVVSTILENLMIKMTGVYEMKPWHEALKEFVAKEKEGGR